MDSSSQSLSVIGAMNESAGSTNPKPNGVSDSSLGGFSKQGLKRDSMINYEKGETSNVLIKKPKTDQDIDNQSIVILDPTPLSIVEPVKPKLSRQFWKAGYDEEEHEPVPRYCGNETAVRVHPQFLHANATSHKWALGALAELLDNSLDEACNGATYVHVDSMKNEKDKKSSILIVEDNGGGMDPSRFRECLSLGYSRKLNMANTIGQYGNGFKTSTMRLGADAIVFSRCRGTNGNNPTQSIGMLSYTFLYETRKCEAIVPTIDFELVDNNWKEITYNSIDEWFDNLETIVKWSPYLTQQDLFNQFDFLEEQGTRVVIYNLWEDDEGKLELDFDTDPHDIQLRGVNRDVKNIEMAKTYPNSKHFLTYRHSLRSYASILYLRLPKNFRIILRGKDVEHHSLLDDMMMIEDRVYRPKHSPEWSPDEDMVAALKIGFVKDAHHHIDVQGFNVYHKNRLIKPFWRVWNAAGSDGRGVIGILEADFIQPAHNKQGFERTAGLNKVEKRLIELQKSYWGNRCHEIGYAQRRKQKNQESLVNEATRQREQRSQVPFNHINRDKGASSSTPTPVQCRLNTERNRNFQDGMQESVADIKPIIGLTNGKQNGLGISFNETGSVNQVAELQKQKAQLELQVKDLEKSKKAKDELTRVVVELRRQIAQLELQLKDSNAKIHYMERSQKVNDESVERMVGELNRQKSLLEWQLKKSKTKIQDLEKSSKVQEELAKLVPGLQTKNAMLELQLKDSKAKIQDLEKSQKSAVMDIFQEERTRRDLIEDDLRKRLRGASDAIDKLTKEVNGLKAEKAYSKMTDAKCN